MPTSVSDVSDNAAVPNRTAAASISAHGRIVTGSGFIRDHNVTIRITRAGEGISDYLSYMADGDGQLDWELPDTATGTFYVAVTDHRPDPRGACGRRWTNTCTLVVASG
jgi:hypothetical protein